MTEKKNKVTYLLVVDRELWERFKAKLNKGKTINEHICEIIRKFVEGDWW